MTNTDSGGHTLFIIAQNMYINVPDYFCLSGISHLTVMRQYHIFVYVGGRAESSTCGMLTGKVTFLVPTST